MIKVLQIRESPLEKCDGIDSNCKGLYNLFSSDDTVVELTTSEYLRHSIPLFHQYYLDSKQIAKSIETTCPDIVHVHGAYSFTLFTAVKEANRYHKKVVFTPHFHPFWSLRRPLLGRLFFFLVTKPLLKKIDAVITLNNEDSSFFKKYHNNVHMIPHWTSFKNISLCGIIKNPKMILFVGRIDESNKGFEHIYQLEEGKYEIHCVGVGTVRKRSDIIHHTSVSDDELLMLYRQSSLVVIPSRYEAFSYVALEALSCGTPILVSDRVRIVDHITACKGYKIFEYKNYSDFRNKVASTIGTQVDVNNIVKKFDENIIKQKYKSLFISLAANN